MNSIFRYVVPMFVAIWLAFSALIAPGSVEAQDASISPEQELANRYAPNIVLKQQDAPCDDTGEPWFPVSVDVVLGNDDVVLRRNTGGSAATDPVVIRGPSASDLFARGSEVYLDLPGNPRHPGCTYERWFDAVSVGYTPMTYAHIVASSGDKLVVQYWFYYVFNRFNNTHESDWEMMQVRFDVGTVAEALQTEPVSIALAQHGGGETADWRSDKVERDGTHPIVYSASGSHATQYGSGVYLGWGENGTGFGCDTTTGPGDQVQLKVVLLPHYEPDPTAEFAWLNFLGRWGERQGGEFNGPTGPATKRQWSSPFLWQDGLRSSSLEIPLARTFGPAPTEFFCSATSWGSGIFRDVGDEPPVLAAIALILLTAIGWSVMYLWPIMREAIVVYRQRWQTYAAVGLTLIPVGVIFNVFQYVIVRVPPGTYVVGVLGKTDGTNYALALVTLAVQQLASLLVIGPMVIETFDEQLRGERPAWREVAERTWRKAPNLVAAQVMVWIVVALLGVTVIGVPIAIWLWVRWEFVSQATVLEDDLPIAALASSSAAVKHRWLRVALIGQGLLILATAPGVLVGLAVLVLWNFPVEMTNTVSSVFYVVLLPLVILGKSLVYRDRALSPRLFPVARRVISGAITAGRTRFAKAQ